MRAFYYIRAMKRIKTENALPNMPLNSKLICTLEGYEDYKGYAIDIEGNVWTCKAPISTSYYYKDFWRKLKTKNNVIGYLFFIMSAFGKDKTARVHRVVALAFCDGAQRGYEVNHKDGNKLNNNANNLEWVSHSENMRHAIKNNLRDTARGARIKCAKLDDFKVLAIKKMLADGMKHVDIAFEYSVDTSTITRINTGDTWRHVNAQP